MSNLSNQMQEVLNGVLSEITVDTDGKGSITRNGLCVLLGISRSNLNVQQMSKKLVEMLAAIGFEDVQRDFEGSIPDTAAACIIEYYALDAQKPSEVAKTLYRAFAAVGVRAWFQDVAGYEKPAVEKTNPYAESLARMRETRDYMDKMIAIMSFSEDKPGQKRVNDYAVNQDGKALEGVLTLDDVLESTGKTYTATEKSAIGMYAATAYRNITGKKPESVIKKYKDSKGRQQTSVVAAYPTSFVPYIENAIELGFGS